MENSGSWRDRLGIVASVLCAIHCAATPVLLAFLPTLQFTEWMASPRFHQIAAIVCVSLVSIAILPAFRRHRDLRILGSSLTGIGMIVTAAFFLPDSCCVDACCVPEKGSVTSLHHHEHSHDDHAHSGHDHSGHTHEHGSSNQLASVNETTLQTAGLLPISWDAIQPWMTPVGGLLLVLAHFLNMRRSSGFACDSRCKCLDESESTDERTIAQAA
jgi:hypothetical protein